MAPRLLPYVEIATRPPKKRQISDSSLQLSDTALSSSVITPRKKRKQKGEAVGRDITRSPSTSLLCPPHSPTVSDFGLDVAVNGRPISPTVSDFAMDDSVIDLMREVVIPYHLIRSQASKPTPINPSGSHVHVEVQRVCSPVDSQGALVYELMDDELLEDEDLVIPGETSLNDSTVTESDSSQDDVPVRLLQDFVIYDMSTNVAVPVGELMSLKYVDRSFGASGFVKPWIDDIDEEDDDDSDSDDNVVHSNLSERVKLSKLLEFDIHHYSNVSKSLDSKIYIRTRFSWYILDSPSAAYKPFFTSFYIQHRLLHLLVTTSLKEPRITYDQFVDSLHRETDENLITYDFLGRELAREDLESDTVSAYIISTLPELCEQSSIRISRVPCIKTIFGPTNIDLDVFDHSPRKGKGKAKLQTTISRYKQIANKEKEVLKHRNSTVVTPVLAHIASDLFKRPLVIAGSPAFDNVDGHVAAEINNIRAHHSDPKSMAWGIEDELGYYSSVTMDGVTYWVGEDVMVNPGDDEDMIRARNAQSDASQSVNMYANRLWFCRICYFFEQEDKKGKKVKMFHGQWYSHGSKTILQETAHSKSLFLMNKCEDNPTASIFKKCNIRMMSPEDEEILDDHRPDANDFHCSLVWSDENTDFTNLPTSNGVKALLKSLPSHMPCVSCAIKLQDENCQLLQHIPNGFTQYGLKYHVGDFIYIRPPENYGVLEVAQIMKIKGVPTDPSVSVCFFGRYDDFVQRQKFMGNGSSPLISDECQLYLHNKLEEIYFDRIDGQCYVQHLTDPDAIEDWVQHPDNFYVNQECNGEGLLVPMNKSSLKCCQACFDERIKKLQHAKMLKDNNEPLRGLELFSGAGGLGTGMNMSGFVETRYAVEFSPSAALTYQTNHPNTIVYCQDSSLLLQHAIHTHEKKRPERLRSNDGKTFCQPMPAKGEVDIIFGGPPCQSFSRANHNPRADDIRSTLPVNMLSYLEHYNCDYFLLENVKGLLDHPLMSRTAKDGRSLEGGIKSGIVKLIMRALIALGYQVRHKVLQAGQYGAPQGRGRVIFWGAKRGLKIPQFPVPVYAFPRGMHRISLPTGGFMEPMTRSLIPGNYHQCAPFKPITVNEAIGDLPAFDWKNPHQTIPEKPRDKREVSNRRNRGIAQMDAVHGSRSEERDLPGFPSGIPYRSEPTNRYQRWIRQGMDDNDLQGHYTKRFGPKLVEATVTVPLRPLADHHDLPLSLRPNHAKPGGRQEKKSFYGRMDGNGHFKCAMTLVAPNIKHSWLLHPSQKRIVSVRECARAQGFPDYYVFKSVDGTPQRVVDNQIRQIGNAVPVPLALALGKALGEVLLEEWEIKSREGSPIV